MLLRKRKKDKAQSHPQNQKKKKLHTHLAKPEQRETDAGIESGIDLRRGKNLAWILEQIGREFQHKRRTPMPSHLKPMLASVLEEPFNDEDWQFEIKWDGYRGLAYVANGKADLRSRNDLSFNNKYPALLHAMKQWPVNAVVDGEVVILSEDGKADFSALQGWDKKPSGNLYFFAFDLLWVEGIDLRKEPLLVRRDVLRRIIPDEGIIRYSDSIECYGVDFYKSALQNGLEGIIAKKKDAPYNAGQRSNDWYKIKAEKRHEAIVCGYTKNKGSDRLFSSLLLGVPNGKGLRYIGQVGTGFTQELQKEILKKLRPLASSRSPFHHTPDVGKAIQWVKPSLLCEVKYTEITKEGVMRHPAFQGLRNDKAAADFNSEESEIIEKNSNSKAVEKLVASKESASLVHIDSQEVKLSNLQKKYWPKERITKGDMLNYYHAMAPFLLPYLLNRPQSLNRFPNGINGQSFYQKNMKGKVEPWLTTFERRSEGDDEAKDFLVCTGEASLLYMVNLGCIELNPWHSRTASPLYPDWCVIDLDPGEISFDKVIQTANVVQAILQSLGIQSYPKTSGSTGLHIYIPLGAKYSYEQSRQLAELLSALVHNELPKITSMERSPQKRKDKIYLDYLQNRPIQTICAPYSLRPKPGATASAPLRWEEVKKGLQIKQFTIKNMEARLKAEGDLFAGVLGEGIDLNKVLRNLSGLL